jgi:uncharacterized protein YqeY
MMEDLKAAMKSGDKLKMTTIRGIQSAIKNKEIDDRVKTPDPQDKRSQDEKDDDLIIGILKTLVKQRKDSIEQFTNGGRPELAECEKYELGILEKYLPSAMPKAEIEKIATDLKAKLGITDKTKMGQLMGAVIKETKGKADGADVKEVVEKLLA